MPTMKIPGSVSGQLDAAASILAAAETIDTTLIKPRISAFQGAHRDYAAAHAKAQTAEAQLGAAQIALGELDVAQDAAVDALARALIGDGKPRTNPFADFAALPPATLMKLSVADEMKAIDQLVARVKLAKNLSTATLNAAQRASKAARAVEQGLADVGKCQANVRSSRQSRDNAAVQFATALAALKRGARAAADDGGTDLYAALFHRPGRGNGKSTKSDKQEDVQPPAPVTNPAQ